MTADGFFQGREQTTQTFLQAWKADFNRALGDDGRAALGEDGCVYAVGSAGRGEVGSHSDLDVFLVTHGSAQRLDEILIQSAVLRATRLQKLPDPSRDAFFLRLYGANELEQRLGAIDDDPENTFTVRMLLLLESRPLYGEAAYERLVDRVVAAYWRNAEQHHSNYLPILLVNDIVRYWRVLLLNYEAKHARKRREGKPPADGDGINSQPSMPQRPSEQTPEQRVDSYKLRFSRCMTCYSMLARLLVEAAPKETAHVTRDAFVAMVRATPVQRLQQVRAACQRRGNQRAAQCINDLLHDYRGYLEHRETPKQELLEIFSDSTRRRDHVAAANRFGDLMFELVSLLGHESPLFRYVVV